MWGQASHRVGGAGSGAPLEHPSARAGQPLPPAPAASLPLLLRDGGLQACVSGTMAMPLPSTTMPEAASFSNVKFISTICRPAAHMPSDDEDKWTRDAGSVVLTVVCAHPPSASHADWLLPAGWLAAA